MAGLGTKLTRVIPALLGFVGGVTTYQIFRTHISKNNDEGRIETCQRWPAATFVSPRLRAATATTDGTCKAQLDAIGYPSRENLIFKTNHILSYNYRLRNANWVFEVGYNFEFCAIALLC
jgi:hypothetical protein